jgi:hypothetical protein
MAVHSVPFPLLLVVLPAPAALCVPHRSRITALLPFPEQDLGTVGHDRVVFVGPGSGASDGARHSRGYGRRYMPFIR